MGQAGCSGQISLPDQLADLLGRALMLMGEQPDQADQQLDIMVQPLEQGIQINTGQTVRQGGRCLF